MFKSTKVKRLVARAITAFLLLGGYSAPAWANQG